MKWPTKRADRIWAGVYVGWITTAPGLIAWGYVAGWDVLSLCVLGLSWGVTVVGTTLGLHMEARKTINLRAIQIWSGGNATAVSQAVNMALRASLSEPEIPTAPLLPEQEVLITGWRGFRLGVGPWLYSLHIEAPPWSKTMIASCSPGSAPGRVPRDDEDIYATRDRAILHLSTLDDHTRVSCGCGIYAYRDAQRLFRNENTCKVWGEVRLEGVVLLHTDGFRAEKATIEHLWVDPSVIVPEFDLVAHLKKEYDCPVDVARWGSFEETETAAELDPRGPATWLPAAPFNVRQALFEFANNPYLGGSNLKSAAVSPPRSGPSYWALLPSPPRLNPFIQNATYKTMQLPEGDVLCDIDLNLRVVADMRDPTSISDLNALIDQLMAEKNLLPGTHATPSVRTAPNQPTITRPGAAPLTADEWYGGVLIPASLGASDTAEDEEFEDEEGDEDEDA